MFHHTHEPPVVVRAKGCLGVDYNTAQHLFDVHPPVNVPLVATVFSWPVRSTDPMLCLPLAAGAVCGADLSDTWQRNTCASLRRGCVCAGCFLPGAAAFEVHAWVQEHLRELAPFQLSSPALPGKVKHLGHDGTVQTAGLMPSIQLNFRWADGPADGPTLSDAAMAMAQMDE